MRRTLRCCSGPSIAPKFVSPPTFYSARRRRQQQAQPPVVDLGNSGDAPSKEEEEQAWEKVTRLGFQLKPTFYTWSAFLKELKRYEFEWRTAPCSYLAYLFSIREYNREAGEFKTVCNLRSDVSASNPVTRLHDVMMLAYRTLEGSSVVPFVNELTHETVNLHIDMTPANGVKAAGSKMSANDRVVTGRLERESVLEPVLFTVAMQTLVYLHLSSIICFLSAVERGLPNYSFLPQDNRDGMEYIWHILRRNACMHDCPWPIDPKTLAKQ